MGTRQASSPAQIKRMQVTARRGVTGCRAARREMRAWSDKGASATFPKQSKVGTAAAFKSTPGVETMGEVWGGVCGAAQQLIAVGGQQAVHFGAALPSAVRTGPAARPHRSRRARSRRKGMAGNVFGDP